MLRPHGHISIVGGDGQVTEKDVAVCAHCQSVIETAVRQGLGWCGRCSAPVCPSCEAKGICVPFEKRLERLEAKDRFHRALAQL